MQVSSANASSVSDSGALVISTYAVCPDITATVTPDLEDPDGKGITHTHKHTAERFILGLVLVQFALVYG